ncbi:hypothetical protein J6590_063692 [Homalodisca vitripennis]|nr:hypothetical protein J6590_063692 [Homalodisca vitripennis]
MLQKLIESKRKDWRELNQATSLHISAEQKHRRHCTLAKRKSTPYWRELTQATSLHISQEKKHVTPELKLPTSLHIGQSKARHTRTESPKRINPDVTDKSKTHTTNLLSRLPRSPGDTIFRERRFFSTGDKQKTMVTMKQTLIVWRFCPIGSDDISENYSYRLGHKRLQETIYILQEHVLQ